jgi:metal-responsive CopG/Arc/MetJ family transcriptional regulator
MHGMRTTIEITEAHRRALNDLAKRRGVRGYSQLIQEALDSYLSDLDAEEIDALLGLEGILDDAETREMRTRIEDARTLWRAS